MTSFTPKNSWGIDIKKIVLSLGLVTIFLYGDESVAENRELLPELVVTVAAFDFPPMAHQTVGGEISGRAVETVKRLCEVSNMKCEMLFYPAVRAYTEFGSGAIDVLMSAKVSLLEECCSFADWYYPFRSGIIADRPIAEIPETESELLGEKIVMIRGWQSAYSYFPHLADLEAAKKIQIVRSNSIGAAIKIYDSGRATLFWGSDAFDWHFNKLSLSNDKRNFKPLTSFPAGMLITKQRQNHDEILRRFNLAFKQYKNLGNLDEDNILIPVLLNDVYKDAPFPE